MAGLMTFTLIVVLCIALLLLLRVVLRRSVREEDGMPGDISNRSDYARRLPDRALLHQCLSPEDLEFIAARRSPGLTQLFLRERRRLALGWLRQIGREARGLYRQHLRSVRDAADLRLSAEAKLLLAVVLFSITYGAILTAVECYGPFRTRRFLLSLQGMANILIELGNRIAGSIAPAGLAGLDAAAGGR